jgi:serine protease Do
MRLNLIVFILISFQFLVLPLSSLNNAYLGVYLEDMSEAEKREYDIREGVLITMVVIDSPAYQKGIMPNDIIIRINDMPINMQDQVRTIIRHAHPGDEILLEILSAGVKKEINITLGDVSEVNTSRVKLYDTKTRHIGAKFQNLSAQLKEYFNTDNGVLIAEIIPDSPADHAGLKAGDIITHTDEQMIMIVNNLKEIIQSKESGDTIVVDYLRRGEKFRTLVEIAEADDLFSFDLHDEIIVLNRKESDQTQVNRWFERVFSDSTKKELENQILLLEKELESLKKRLFNQ